MNTFPVSGSHAVTSSSRVYSGFVVQSTICSCPSVGALAPLQGPRQGSVSGFAGPTTIRHRRLVAAERPRRTVPPPHSGNLCRPAKTVRVRRSLRVSPTTDTSCFAWSITPPHLAGSPRTEPGKTDASLRMRTSAMTGQEMAVQSAAISWYESIALFCFLS